MRFAELNAAVVELRRSLRIFVGETALGEIHVRPPARENDEASFMRLVNWSYVLLFELGRITVPYLTKLPSVTGQAANRFQEGREIVHDLRTWSSHNIGFSSERDAAISKRVSTWFLAQCKATEPQDEGAWRLCFERLCSEVGMIVEHCRNALASIAGNVDEAGAIEELRHRLDRSWPPERFDEIVADTCIRLGVSLNVPGFRGQRLAKWREFLATVPDADDPRGAITRLIERDVADHTNDVLPISGNDVMASLALPPGPRVGAAIRRARELFRSGIRDPQQLLERLQIEATARRASDDDEDLSGRTAVDEHTSPLA